MYTVVHCCTLFYTISHQEEDWISSDALLEMYQGFIKDYPVISIEDPFDQDDWEGYAKLTKETEIQIVGDDLLVTNPTRYYLSSQCTMHNAQCTMHNAHSFPFI